MAEMTEHTQVVDLFISFVMFHPDNCCWQQRNGPLELVNYSPTMLNLLTAHAQEQTFVYRGLTLPRNLIILHEILDFLGIMCFLAIYRHANDRSDIYEYDL